MTETFFIRHFTNYIFTITTHCKFIIAQIDISDTRHNNFHFARSIAICLAIIVLADESQSNWYLPTYGNRNGLVVQMHRSDTTILKSLPRRPVKSYAAKRISTTTWFLPDWRFESWERDLRHPSMVPSMVLSMAKMFADVYIPLRSVFSDAASNTEFYRAWKARNTLSVWKRFKLALRSSRFEKKEREREKEWKRKNRRLSEREIFTVSDRFLVRQSTDTLLVNVKLLF